MHTGTCRDIKNPCEVRSSGLRVSTVSGTSQLSLTVSLAATTTTTNRCTLPCPALPCPDSLSTGGCLSWPVAAAAAGCPAQQCIYVCAFQFGTGPSATNMGLVVFSSFPKMSSSTFSLLSFSFLLFSCLSHSLILAQYVSLGPGGLWACG